MSRQLKEKDSSSALEISLPLNYYWQGTLNRGSVG